MKINRYVNPDRSLWKELCLRPSDTDTGVRERVMQIIDRVRRGGDEAICAIASEIEGRPRETLELSESEIAAARESVSSEVRDAIAEAAKNIREFHKAELPREIEVETAPGVRCIQRPVPIEKVGLYIPGGTAPLFSTVLMLAIPARLAGCREIILCTPSSKKGAIAPEVLFAASYCGIDHIFRIGGAQAIAAMALGTDTVPKVDKIFGPGNQYVTVAKQILGASSVAVDMPAGPSEVMVIADENSNPTFVAADLLSQAEHGRDSQVILATDSGRLADEVEIELEKQLESLERCEIASCALEKSHIVILPMDEIVDFVNEYAPEHLIISLDDAWPVANRITTAGSVFVGAYTPESAGDYASGTNHTLPTCGWARAFSGVNMDSFMRKMTIQEISREGLSLLGKSIVPMAEAEGLQAHANAVKVRISDYK